jgi:hypothetical protein
MIIKKIIAPLVYGAAFFSFGFLSIIIFGYVLAPLRGLQYDFHMAVQYGVRCGLYLGGVMAILAFIGVPRRGPPF